MVEKKRFLVKTVFETAKNEIPKGSKSSISSYLSSLFEERYGFEREERSYVRYYKKLVEENRDYNIDDLALDYLSKYIGYNNFEDFCSKVKFENDDSKTFSLSFNELTEKFHQIIIKVTPPVLIPDFIKKNGFGIMEAVLLLSLVTGGVMYSGNKGNQSGSKSTLGIFSQTKRDIDKTYMYWNGEKYIATDSNYIRPEFDVVAMNKNVFTHLKKITKPDTLTVDNAFGKVWYDKSHNEVSFFTAYGEHPENGKTLKVATSHILTKYGKQQTPE